LSEIETRTKGEYDHVAETIYDAAFLRLSEMLKSLKM
jgi:hypothetical protein